MPYLVNLTNLVKGSVLEVFLAESSIFHGMTQKEVRLDFNLKQTNEVMLCFNIVLAKHGSDIYETV